jgi:branched-chain amino acid transport system permease protein
MDVLAQILASGLTLGAMYAISTVGLLLVYGSMNMLNTAHGAMLTIGGYAAYAAATELGLPSPIALVAAMLVGAVAGLLLFFTTTVPLLNTRSFETNIFIATIGVGAVLEDGVLKTFGPYAKHRPLTPPGAIKLGNVALPYQNLAILFVALIMMALVALLLQSTRAGRAIRATSQNREAAQLLGVHVERVYAQVLALSGVLAAISAVMVSSLTALSLTMGGDPMLKAFIVCVVAGLGNTYGAVVAAIAIGPMEAAAQYELGVRFGFASLLLLLILALIWRPSGVFGKSRIVRQ